MLYTLFPTAWNTLPLIMAYPANGKQMEIILSAVIPRDIMVSDGLNMDISTPGAVQKIKVPTDIKATE